MKCGSPSTRCDHRCRGVRRTPRDAYHRSDRRVRPCRPPRQHRAPRLARRGSRCVVCAGKVTTGSCYCANCVPIVNRLLKHAGPLLKESSSMAYGSGILRNSRIGSTRRLTETRFCHAFPSSQSSNSLGTRRVSSIRYEHSTRGCASSSETLDRARKTNWNLSLIFILSIARLLRAVIDCVQTSDFVLVLA